MRETVEFDNQCLSYDLPEGFHVMDEAEVKKVSGRTVANQVALRNTSRHLMYNITWKKISLFGKLSDFDKVVRNTKKSIKGMLNTYEEMEDLETVIDGIEARGFRYAYMASNQKHVSDYLVLKHNGYFIAFISISRYHNYEKNLPVFDSIIKSVKFK